MLYLSGITLALFETADRARIIQLAEEVRSAGGQVAFDPNYRPRLWASQQACQDAILELAPHISIALPSFDDEAALWGDADPQATADRWKALGVTEVIVKNGVAGTWTSQGVVRGTPVAQPTDTTGAGDSFNAGYLAARLAGSDTGAAALAGGNLAAIVIQHRGAIIPQSAMPQLS